MKDTVLIVGTGLAALASAIRLNEAGYYVEIIEKNDKPGGRLGQLSIDGFTFDIGPTFFSMSYEFKQFLKECNVKTPFRFKSLDPLYDVYFDDKTEKFSIWRDPCKLHHQFKDIEPDFQDKLMLYICKCSEIFNDSMDLVIRRNHYSISDYFLNLAQVKKKHLPKLFSSVQKQVNKNFSSAEARLILSLAAYFLGSTPTDTNGVYSLLTYTEFLHDGYHAVEGGMYEIINTLIKEIDLRGIPVHYNREIVSFRKHDGQVISLVDNKGNHYAFENYIINMDAALFRSKILQRKTYSPQMMRNMKWSMGFLTFYLGIDVELPQLNMHNYFIGKDDKDKNMKSFRSDVIPDNPYFYVNVCSKMNEKAAPEGSEALMFVVPVPNLINRKNWDDKQQIVDSIIKEFGDRIGLDLSSHIVTQHIMTPVDWSDQFNLYAGAGLGLNHSMWQTGYFRPENKDEVYENLYYTGASTVPGIGLPMAIISSRLTTERLINNH